VSKILSGTKPADIPVERATRFELIVNLGTANALGRRLPESLLSEATDAIR
jgi:putative tryptophan/tyrosine transport system substrate-binding protein